MDVTVLAGIVGATGVTLGAGIALVGAWLSSRTAHKTALAQIEAERQQRQDAADESRRRDALARQNEVHDAWRDRKFEAYRTLLTEYDRIANALHVAEIDVDERPTNAMDAVAYLKGSSFRDAMAEVEFLGSDGVREVVENTRANLVFKDLIAAAVIRDGEMPLSEPFSMELDVARDCLVEAIRVEFGLTSNQLPPKRAASRSEWEIELLGPLST